MSQLAKIGSGSTVKWNGIKLNDVKKIGNIPLTNSEVDVTDLDSLAKEFIAGLKDYGSCTIEGNFLGTGAQASLFADAKSGVIRAVEISLVRLGLVYTFDSFVKSFNFGEATPEGVTPFTAELRITGDVNAITADLTTLAISEGTFVPGFAAAIYEYTVIVTDPTVTVTPTLAGSVITVNGTTVASGVASGAINIPAADVTDIIISVTKAGGISTYTIHCGKA